MGPNFVARTQQDTGADAATVARAYTVAREAFDVRELWRAIEQLDNRVPATVQYAMMHDTVATAAPGDLLADPASSARSRHRGAGRAPAARACASWRARRARLAAAGSNARPSTPARPSCCAPACRRSSRARSPRCHALHCAPDIVELAQARRLSVEAAARAYVTVGAEFGLDWLRERIEALDTEGHWHAVARGSLREGTVRIASPPRAARAQRDRGSAIRPRRSHNGPGRARPRPRTRAASSTTYARSRRRSTSPRSRSRCRRCGAGSAESPRH